MDVEGGVEQSRYCLIVTDELGQNPISFLFDLEELIIEMPLYRSSVSNIPCHLGSLTRQLDQAA